MIASVELAEISPAPTFWIWRLILVPSFLPTDTTPFPVAVWKLSETFVPPIVSSVIALTVAVTDESPIATSPSAVFAVAPRPNATAPACPASATAPRVVALAADATDPRPTAVASSPVACVSRPIAVALVDEAFALLPIAIAKLPVAFTSPPTATVQLPVAFA